MKRRTAARIVRALEELPPPPCVGCQHLECCAVERQACGRFIQYTNGKTKGRRDPSRKHFMQLFPSTEAP